MNCVYTAFNNHLAAIDQPEYMNVFKEYRLRKEVAHPDPLYFTFAGIVPWLYWHMLLTHNTLSRVQVEMRIQRHYVPLLELFEEANDAQKIIMSQNTKFWGAQVDKVTLEPAIYCMLNEQHAYYAEEIPSSPGARIIMAIQLMRQEKEMEIDR